MSAQSTWAKFRFTKRKKQSATPMPFYEFYCPENHTVYTFFARSMKLAERVPRCPENPALSMRRILSRFAVNRGASASVRGDAELDDPATERAIARMEGAFSALDSDRPDPRALGRSMRELCALSGESLDARMEEVIGRLEKGEDPDRIEEEYGDALDAMFGEEGDPDSAENGIPARLGSRFRNRRPPPRREARVFEMEAYLDDEP